MPQLQNLVIADGETTPVTHTFVPRDIVSGVGTVVEAGTTPIGENRITVSMKKAGTRYKGELRITMPVVATETINGVSRPTIVRTAYGSLSVSFDEKSTMQERKNLVTLIASALNPNRVLVNDALVNLQGVY